ncbi:efflux RND transporter permease subunit [Burkholderia ubonensis]|uniref:efflux RND transporter permease subunit n=1 Tax=Burkholderia ubonensis TaxID=101571 RepID=UPI00075BB322|nr:efflux RND transporter permease subunit [Burkholderia ubonensis]KVL62358.1 RND transporter [Burkholderia ubonensis]KVL69542.1 RND transporter [Burkholderia ubonensis]KVL96188.1 RND transporter [Burkholderia ubonensis]
MLNRLVSRLERGFFGHRAIVLAAIGLFTATMAAFAVQLRMDAGFEKQMPIGHEYIRTFQKYRNDLLGANRITVVVRARKGPIWTKEGLTRLYKVTQAVTYLPNVDRIGVRSLWTPNAFVNEITDEGFRAEPIISGTITPDQLTPEIVTNIRRATTLGGYVGTLVSHDEDSAMITAELNERDRAGNVLDYVAFNRLLEQQIRKPFEDAGYEIQIIGFAKQIGDIADGATAVLGFCGVALLLTALAVYWYCHSVRFTVLLIVCSLTSLVWQFGTLKLLGFGLDPLAVLVPFLVFAIGVSHGVQQVNFIVREISHGHSSYDAARRSFSGLLIPGVLALITAFVSFITLLLIPIPMVRELAITASLGVAYKIVTNLILLPVAASCFNFSKTYADSALKRGERRSAWLRGLARIAQPKYAGVTVAATLVVFALAAWQSRDRVIGTLQPGAPELRADARFNRDATSIAGNYDMGLDWLTVAIESSGKACDNPAVGLYEDDFTAAMRTEPGVVSVQSYSALLRTYNQGYNEDYPKMNVVPIAPENYGAVSVDAGRIKGFMNGDCSMTAVHLFLTDHKATTINRILDDVKQYRAAHAFPGIGIRLAAGNAGVLAATNDEVEKSELPMMLYVYAAILILVFLAYRDWRAMLACCVPLSVATFIGYWFMKELQIGLTVATLPVMVLAVGIGVDYAFYIYNRLQVHLAGGQTIVKAVQHAMLEVGVATIFTAITLAIGVATWSFSALKFQADMGKLLAFMFLVNLLMAMTALPALASVLERWFPRRKPARAPGLFSH